MTRTHNTRLEADIPLIDTGVNMSFTMIRFRATFQKPMPRVAVAASKQTRRGHLADIIQRLDRA